MLKTEKPQQALLFQHGNRITINVHIVTKTSKEEEGQKQSLDNQHDPIWTRLKINELRKKTPTDVIPNDIRIKNLNVAHNTHWSLCICNICKQILRRPIMFKQCEHVFCLDCLQRETEWKK